MNYETICKYVFEKENISWELHDSKKRDVGLVLARQISIYVVDFLYPNETWTVLGSMFKKDHASAMHSVKQINDLMTYDSDLRRKVFAYCDYARQIEAQEKEREIKEMLELRNTETMRTLLDVIDKMELVAKIYCEITNNKIVKV